MANYTTNLKTWGATGQAHPDNYSYVENEAPVDVWDNFLNHNLISDVKDHLIPLTNSRIESDISGSRPTDPEDGHLFYDTSKQVFEQYRTSDSSWHQITFNADLSTHTSDTSNPHSVTLEQVRSGGGSFSGDVSFGGNAITDLSFAEFSSGDIRVNHAARELLVDEHDGSSWTTRLSVDETGASVTGDLTTSGTLTVSGSSTFDSNVDLAGNTLEKIGSATFSDWTVTEDGTSGNLEATHSGSTILDIGNNTVNVSASLQEKGNPVATKLWTENNADVPNADYADSAGDADTVDGKHAADLGSGVNDSGTQVVATATTLNFNSNISVTDNGNGKVTIDGQATPDTHTSISEDGTKTIGSVDDIDFTGHLNVIDDGDGGVTLDPTHNHDSTYVNQSDHTKSAHDELGINASSADEASSLIAGGNLKGDLNAVNGETLWDESGGYIPQAQLQNNSVTVAGNAVSLGGSTAISHGDLSDAPASAHHAKYTDQEAVDAVNAKNSLSVDISGDADTVDGKNASDLGSGVSDSGTEIVGTATDFNFNSNITVSNDGDGTVTIDGDSPYSIVSADTITLTSGTTVAFDGTITNVTTDEDAQVEDVIIKPNSENQTSADYAVNHDWGTYWDDTNGELDLNLTVNWDTDPSTDMTFDVEVVIL